MIDRVTFHVRDGIAVTGVGKIYDPAKRKTRTMAGAVIRLSEYEDTGLDPWEIVKLKAERDAAVRDLERIAQTGDGYCHVCTGGIGGKCIHKHEFIVIPCGDCRACVCAECLESAGFPYFRWRGPQQEET